VNRVRQFLINEAKIDPEQIAIQTGKKKDLPSIDVLLSKECPIRYIITVNALREGWDCPFAYVLVSISNLGARLSVEQTIGRIMRLPYAKERSDSALNSAYIFASTRNFTQTSEMVIRGLQSHGYEDIIQIVQGVSVSKNEFKRKIKDKKINLPYINIKRGNRFRKLDYIGDLISNASILENKSIKFNFQILDNSQVIKIDIGHDGELMKDRVGKLVLVYHCKDLTEDDLLHWFTVKIQRGFIAIDEMNAYLKKVISKLLKKYNLSQLSVHRYQIKEIIEKQIDQFVNDITTKRFNSLIKSRMIIAKGTNFLFPDILTLSNICPDSFKNHLYEKGGKMNKEELELAYQIDNLDNILWWFRNPELGGFYIQGWLKNKFYPDFIVKTKKGNYIVIEYKGAQFEESKDTEYKKAIGKKWQELSNKNYYFELVNKKNMDEIMTKISKL